MHTELAVRWQGHGAGRAGRAMTSQVTGAVYTGPDRCCLDPWWCLVHMKIAQLQRSCREGANSEMQRGIFPLHPITPIIYLAWY